MCRLFTATTARGDSLGRRPLPARAVLLRRAATAAAAWLCGGLSLLKLQLQASARHAPDQHALPQSHLHGFDGRV